MTVAVVALLLSAQQCHVRGLLPDPACTPGAVETTDLAIICGQRTSERRRVSATARRRVLDAYGYSKVPGLEVDHLIPLELGGSNAILNLWPETPPGFHEKDKVENRLHKEVCAGRMTIEAAQILIAKDWTQAR
jgi:hypothetical protein